MPKYDLNNPQKGEFLRLCTVNMPNYHKWRPVLGFCHLNEKIRTFLVTPLPLAYGSTSQ